MVADGAGGARHGGATAVEYALVVAAIAALIVIVVLVVGRQTFEGFCDTSSAMTAAGSTPNPDCP